MNAHDWEKLQRNMEDLLGINPVYPIIIHLYENDVIELSEKVAIEKIKVYDRQMKKLLKILKGKPEKYKGFRHFVDALKIDPVNKLIADKITGTESKSDTSLKNKTNPDMLNETVRKILLSSLTCIPKETIPVSEVRELLKAKSVFSGQDEWSNEKLIEFVKETFTRVEVTKVKRPRKRTAITCFVNIGPIFESVQSPPEVKPESHEEPKELEKIQISEGVSTECKEQKELNELKELKEQKEVRDMSNTELRDFLTSRLEQEGQPTEDLCVLEMQNISGKIFLTMKEEDFDKVLPKTSTYGVKKTLALLITELSHKTNVYRAFLRRFDTEVTHTDKYTKGHCTDVSINIRGRKTLPVRNFYLIEDTDQENALIFISEEVVPFVSACLNDRRNGTIYFGISPAENEKFSQGEIVGVCLPKEEVEAEIREALSCSFTENQKEVVLSTVRDVRFVPVIDTEDHRYVIELDIVPATVALDKDIVRTKEKFLPDHFRRNHKGKDVVVFKFSDEGFPKVVSSEELCLYEKVQPRIVEQRKQEEESLSNAEPSRNLRVKLLNFLTGGSETIQDVIFPFLMTSPLDEHMNQDYLTNRTKFIKHLQPQVVFDFDDNGADAGLLKNLEDKHEESLRILTTDDFDEAKLKIEQYNELRTSLDQEMKIVWMLCNGYKDMSIPALKPLEWNRDRSGSFQKALKCFMDIYEKDRITIIICLFSSNYVTMIEACDEVLRKLPDNWIVLAETEDIARLWQDQILCRNRANRSDVNERCVVGLPWEQVNLIICQATNKEPSENCCLPSSTGAFVEIREKKLKDWSDISVLPAKNFDLKIAKNEKEKREKTVEEKFYRGEQVDWWNFVFHDQVLKRDVHDTLMENVRKAVAVRRKDDQDCVNVVSILHQPGAGGTTSAKQILWDLRNEFRCCVVDRITPQTCAQIDDFRLYKEQRPKPVVILVDNEEKFDQLRDSLEEKGRERLHYGNEVFKVYCVIIACLRRTSLPFHMLKEDHVALRQEFTPKELEWFKNRHKTLMKRYNDNKNENVNPEFLIAFNILRHNFNKDYVSNVVKAFTQGITDEREIKLLKIVALLNTYDPDFKGIPISCFDQMLNYVSSRQQGKRNVNWEAKLSQAVKVLLNLSSNKKLTSKNSQHLQVCCKVMAQEVLSRMKERTGQKDSNIMLEILNHVFHQTTSDFKSLQAIINNIFKKRDYQKNGLVRNKFSEFILQVESNENVETVAELLELLYSLNSDPFTAQLLARYYIEQKCWDKAKHFAKSATGKLEENSFLWDTYGQVFKSQLYELVSFEKNLQEGMRFKEHDICEFISLGKMSIWAFRRGQSVSELEPSTNEENNLASYFGELRVIALLLSALELSTRFKDRDALHSYLTSSDKTDEELTFLGEEEQEFLKSLEQCSKEAMRRLDDEFLQMKGKSAYTTDRHETDRKTLIDLKASLDVYFGECSDEVPKYYSEVDSCAYRRRRARLLGAKSLHSLLELRKDGKKEILSQIFQLLHMNVASKERNFDDLRSMLDIVTVCLLDRNLATGITYVNILDWCKQMYLLGKQKQTNDRYHLEMFLYFVLYNFPTEERSTYGLRMEADLKLAIEEWRKAFNKNYPKSVKYLKRRETTLFFLGNGPPLLDLVFFEKAEVLQMYTTPQFRKNVRILNGVLAEGGHEVIVKVKVGSSREFSLSVPTASPVQRNEMFKRKIYFFLGFSFSGPKAFGMCVEPPQPIDTPLFIATGTSSSQRMEQPETLDLLINQSRKYLMQLLDPKLPPHLRSRIYEEQDQVRKKIRILLGERLSYT
uniref:CARD domain-containing protein n=1 Tax=Biomphalaria glabrata TaxID=6526 RepID=A0A2C9LZQ5_BIOGL